MRNQNDSVAAGLNGRFVHAGVPLRALASTLLLMLSAAPAAVAQDVSNSDRLFTMRVLPVLKEKCFGCHGEDPEDIRGGLDVRSRDALLAGGFSEEPSIVPGEPEQSTLYQAVLWEGYEMPPKENDRLSEKQVKDISQWIAAGAPWPDKAAQEKIREAEWAVGTNAEGTIVSTSGGTSEEWTYRRYQPSDTWVFQEVRPKDQLLRSDIQLSGAIDHFLDRQLAKAEIEPAAQASPRTLIHRATLDLTGLPPKPKEIDAFKKAWSRDADKAWADLIDRLLASPRYGERWARHWFDVTRYADTGGMSNDYERSNMWRYRDYVIRAFNEDKPYDQFVLEQLAGDELADQSVRERTGGDLEKVHEVQLDGDYTPQESERIIATGFLRLGPWDNAMIEDDEARQIYLDDLVNITGQAFLGQTLRCCKCHDHKFDPIPTRDYYRLYAAFSTTHMAERPVPFLPEENLDGFEEGKAHVQKMLDFAVSEKNKLIEKREAAARAWFEKHDLPYKDAQERKNLPDEEKPPRHVGLNHVEQGQLKVREQDEWIWERRLERYQPIAQSVYNAAATDLAWNGARKLRIDRKSKAAEPPATHILNGGALSAPGDEVQAGVLSAVGLPVHASAEDRYLVTDKVNGRRLELAKWIAHSDNGLTTRAIVNRIWQYHFGTALAANPNNLGAKGGKPSHPELLDYLAGDFVEHGWKTKRLHRAIMMSQAYRRATVPGNVQRVAKADPNNRLLSFFPRRRLTAEEIRDGMLAVTGELNHCRGGVPIKPEINMEVALQPRMIQFSLAPAYQPSRSPERRNRRTIYAYHVRGQADPFIKLFNQPNPNDSCERRESASVTPQVFTLLNSDGMADRSIAFALRLQRERDTLPEQVERAFRLAFGRFPSAKESQWMQRYVKDMRAYHEGVQPAAPEYPTEITRSLVEEFSGDTFEYQEILPVFDNYHPDKKPSDVSPETRALADMCLLLLNTNEFMYAG